MTLLQFQSYTKIFIAITSIILYGLAAFTVGKIIAGKEAEVKGVSLNNYQENVFEKPLPTDNIQSNEILSKSLKFCTNTTHGFEVAYPSDWFTTYNNEDEQCTLFAPYSFIVPQFTDENFVPIKLEVLSSNSWQSTINFYENPNDFYNIISSKNIEINGRLVKEIESQTTGEGNRPRGLTVVHYLSFDGEKPIRFSYYQLEENEDTSKAKIVLKEIVESLKYF